MKRTPLIIGGIVGVAALWSAGWYAGKVMYVEPQADAAVEGLRGGSLFFSYDNRTIGGFPFGYDVAYNVVAISDASTLWRWTADWARLKTGVADGGAVVATVAPGSSILVEQAMFGGQAGAPPAVFEVVSDDLEATLTGSGNDNEVLLQASEISVLQKSGAIVISGGEARLTDLVAEMAFSPDEGVYVGEVEADSFALSYRLSPDGVTETTSQSEMTGVEITFSTRAVSGGELAEMIANEGEAKFEFSAATYKGQGGTSGGPSAPPVIFTYEGEESVATVDVVDGQARYSGELDGFSLIMKVDAPGPFPGPAFSLEGMKMAMEMPLKQSPDPQPYLLSMSVDDLALDDTIWAAFDPTNQLDHEEMEIEAKLTGDARVLTDFGEVGVSSSPIDLETLVIDALAVKGLGAEISATGSFEIAGDAARSNGAMDVEMKGVLALLDDFLAAGLIPPQAEGSYRALLQQLAVQDGDDDRLTTRVESRNGLVSLNGQVIGR